jgi:hypothetical protein
VEVNRSGKCEGLGGGDQRGALCTGFTLVYVYVSTMVLFYGRLETCLHSN